MPQGAYGGDVMDSTNDTMDAGLGIVDIFSLQNQLSKDCEQYGLTDDEITELRDAYLAESIGQDLAGRIGLAGGAWLRKATGVTPRRTPDEIINAAKARMGTK